MDAQHAMRIEHNSSSLDQKGLLISAQSLIRTPMATSDEPLQTLIDTLACDVLKLKKSTARGGRNTTLITLTSSCEGEREGERQSARGVSPPQHVSSTPHSQHSDLFGDRPSSPNITAAGTSVTRSRAALYAARIKSPP
jgi:hypothetical protein